MSRADLASAKERFYDARRRALREDLLARLANRPRDLLPYDAVAHALKNYQHIQLTELRIIPLAQIIGSVGRYRDFTRSFQPRGSVRPDRWARIDVMMDSPEGLRPIEVYQIGAVYFVADGNHRVSVALANGATHLEAWVTTIPVDAEIQPGDTLDEAIIKAECAHFVAQTRLAESCGGLDLAVTRPGAYPRLLEQIYAHRLLTGEKVSFPQAAARWHQQVYLPLAEHLRSANLLRKFPARTSADLYVWLAERLVELAADADCQTWEDLSRRLAKQARVPLTDALRRVVECLAPLAVGHAGDDPGEATR